jgi:peptidoglycan/LPS O-acetylase OafA/YrhL
MVNSPPEGTVRGEQRLRHIDALRAIAALLVLWRHVADAFVGLGPGVSGRWMVEWSAALDFGRIGVVTFFLVSGYVIPFSIHPERPAPVGTFLIKRFLRIYPAYWLSIPLGAFATCWIWGLPFGVRDFLVGLTLLQDFFGARSALGLYWTLLVEWAFYLLCVVLLVSGSFSKPRRWLLLSVAFTAIYSAEMLVHWMTGTSTIGSPTAFGFLNLSLMLLGALYRQSLVESDGSGDRWLRHGVLGLLAWHLLILPVGATLAIGAAGNATIPYALGLLVFVGGVSFVQIRSRLTDWLGRISYSIYLFHPVVFMLLLWALLRLPPQSVWRAQHLGVYLLVNALITVAFATLVYRFVERPAIELGRRVARWWVSRTKGKAWTRVREGSST